MQLPADSLRPQRIVIPRLARAAAVTDGWELSIVGASVRAAAASARRAGVRVRAADLFADDDLKSIVQPEKAERIADYPSGFLAWLGRCSQRPWMYTGGLENHPEFLAAAARRAPLAGNRADVVRKVRDPFQLAAQLRSADLPMPAIRAGQDSPTAACGHWIFKQRGTAAGLGVRWKNSLSSASEGYWQRFVDGHPWSAVYVAETERAILIGATTQLTGVDARRQVAFADDSEAGRDFRYAGSIGPRRLSSRERDLLVRLGNMLIRQFRLVGLFGVDLIDADGHSSVLEVNPRYPASAEILERALGWSAVASHLAACRLVELPVSDTVPQPQAAAPGVVYGKRICYARRGGRFGPAAAAWANASNGAGWPRVADIPAWGSPLERHRPVATVFASGRTERDVYTTLCDRAAQLDRHLQGAGGDDTRQLSAGDGRGDREVSS